MAKRDLVAERAKLKEGKPVAIRVSDLTDLELHQIKKAKPSGY